jgi:hypothetical protein
MDDISTRELDAILANLKSIAMERIQDGNGNPWRVHLYGAYTRDDIRAILYLMDKGME